MGGADTGSCDEARRTRFVGRCGYWPTVGGRCGVARPSLPIPLARGGGEGKAAWRLSCATSDAAHPWRSTWAAEQLWRSETRPIIRDGRGAVGKAFRPAVDSEFRRRRRRWAGEIEGDPAAASTAKGGWPSRDGSGAVGVEQFRAPVIGARDGGGEQRCDRRCGRFLTLFLAVEIDQSDTRDSSAQ